MDVMDDTTTTENPSSAASPSSSADHSSNRADLEAAVASLHASFNVKGGDEAESVDALERLLIAREAELQAKFCTPSSRPVRRARQPCTRPSRA
jgi:hypothetical protein